MGITVTNEHHSLGVDFGGADLTVDGGTCRLSNCRNLGDITIENGVLIATSVQAGGVVTLNSGTGESIQVDGLRCNGMVLNGGSGFQDVIINRLQMSSGQLLVTGDFYEFSMTEVVIGQRSTSPAAALPAVVFDGVTGFKFSAEVYRSARQGMIFDDCKAADIYATIIDPSAQTDNTYDGIQLTGVCDRLALYGSVRGAVRQANNPRYGMDVAATCLAIDSYMALSGYQTGAINDPGTVVTVH